MTVTTAVTNVSALVIGVGDKDLNKRDHSGSIFAQNGAVFSGNGSVLI